MIGDSFMTSELIMEVLKEKTKKVSSRDQTRLRVNNQAFSSYKRPQEQNTPNAAIYEEEFPSLSEVGVKWNSNDTNLPSPADSLSYSARLKALSQKKQSQNANINIVQNSDMLPSSHSSNVSCPSTRMQNKKYSSGIDQMTFSKHVKPLNKSSAKKCEVSESFSSNDVVPENGQRPFIASDCDTQAKEVEGEWIIVRNKFPFERHAFKESGRGKYRSSESNQNPLNKQSSSGCNFVSQGYNKQTVDINRVHSHRENINRSGTFSSIITTQRVNATDAHHLQSNRKHFPIKAIEKEERLVHPRLRSSQWDKEPNAVHGLSEPKHEITSYRNPISKENFADPLKSCENRSAKLSGNEHVKSLTRGLNKKEKGGVPKIQFSSPMLNNHESNLKQNPRHFKANIDNPQEDRSENLGLKNVKKARCHELGNTARNNSIALSKKFRSAPDFTQSYRYSTSSNNKNNASSKENQRGQLNRSHVTTLNSVGSSRKKRRSRVKRQAASQSDKIRIISQETYSKILNQNNMKITQTQKNISVNINDWEEYPELGAVITPRSDLEIISKNSLKKEIPVLSEKYSLKVKQNDINSLNTEFSIENSFLPKDSDMKENELSETECKFAEEEKLPVHYNDPITISIFDMLLANKSKIKESEKIMVPSVGNSSFKVNSKKLTSFGNHHFVNLLDSSKPAVKRGKERERPKPKRISQLKKIILMDRKKRKELILQQSAKRENRASIEKDDSIGSCDAEHLRFNKNVIDEITLELLNQSNGSLENSVFDKDAPTSEMECFQKQVSNSKCGEAKLFRQNSPSFCLPAPNKEKNRNLEICSASSSSNMSTDLDKFAENFDLKKMDPDIFKNIADLIVNDLRNIQISDSKCSLTSAMLIDFLKCIINSKQETGECSLSLVKDECITKCDNNCCDFKKKELHLQSEDIGVTLKCKDNILSHIEDGIVDVKWIIGFLEKCFQKVTTKYNVFIDNQGKISDDILSEIKLSFENQYKHILKCKRNYYDFALSDIRFLFRNNSEEETLIKVKTDSIVNDIRYLFESQSNTLLATEELTKNTVIPLDDNISINFISDSETVEKVVGESHGTAEEITKSDQDTLPLATIPCEVQECSDRRYSDKEISEASFVLLHSKKFRSYCTQFLSISLEEAVVALLDDLARFQDRMHQKDPVKARMKRRLLYGMREIKRHVKLKKLKCIIIASDIEDSKTEGGLNDILNDLKSLANDHQIPCIFSLQRKKLGRICRKSAPVSAVGVYNYEGSEVNFKKMLELQKESKLEYAEVVKALSAKLSDEQIDFLLKTKEEDSPNLHIVATKILRENFPKREENTSKTNTIVSEKTKCLSTVDDIEIHSLSEETSVNKEISLVTMEKKKHITFNSVTDTGDTYKIYDILVKYKIINY